MANEKIILTLQIDGVKTEITNVKELKQAIKDSNNEMLRSEAGSESFKKAAKNISELKGKLGDLGDAARIEGTATEQLSTRFSLLRESLATGDMDKAKLALGGIGGAMKAIPILALAEGARIFMENFGAIVEWGKDFFDVMSDSERAVRNLNIQLKEQQATNKILIQSLEDEISLMKAQGATEEQVIARKKQITALKISEIETQIMLNKHKLTEVKNQVEFNDVLSGTIALTMGLMGLQKGAAKESLKNLKDRADKQLEVQREIESSEATIAHLKKSLQIEEVTLAKKTSEDKKKIRDDEQAELLEAALRQGKWETDNYIFLEKQEKDRAAQVEAERKAGEQKDIDDIFAQGQKEVEAYVALNQEQLAADAAAIKRRLAIHAAFEANKFELAQAGINAAKSISDLLIQGNLNNVKKGSAQELALKKKQFEVNKGIDIARATIDGIKGAQAQLHAGPIVGPILAAAVGVTALANVLKIKNTKFSDSGGASIADTGGTSMPSPTIPTAQTTPRIQSVDSTRLNSNGVVEAVVVETQMTESQKRILRLKNQATFG